MNSTVNTAPPRPITARIAENGLYLSVFMCALILLMGACTRFPFLALFFFIGAVAMPFFAFSLLCRNCMRSGGFLSFSEIWAEGIASFFHGSHIPAVLCYVSLRFVFPDFLPEQIQKTVDTFREMGTPQAQVWVDMIEKMRADGVLPTPADVAANIISINIVAGTAVSLIMAIVLSARMRIRRMRQRQDKL